MISVPLLKSSPILFEFLTLIEDKLFERLKSDYDKEKRDNKQKLPPDFESIEGIIKCHASKETLNAQENIILANSKLSVLLSDLDKDYEDLKENFNKVSLSLFKVSDSLNKIADLSQASGEFPKLSEAFSMLSEINREMSMLYTQQLNVFENEFRDLFTTYREDLSSFCDDLESQIKGLKDDYLNSYVYVTNKKEKLFTSHPVSKWEIIEDLKTLHPVILFDKKACLDIMCKKDTQALEEKKTKLGIFCNSRLENFNQLKYYYGEKFKDSIISLSSNNSSSLAGLFALVKLLNLNAEKMKKL